MMGGFDRERVWHEGYAAGRSDLLDDVEFSELIAEEAKKRGFDLCEGVGIQWDDENRILVFYET